MPRQPMRTFRCSDSEWESVKTHAQSLGVTASELIRTALKELIEKENEK